MIIDIGIFSLVYYITLIIGAIGVIYISYDIQRKLRPKYLSIYFWYLKVNNRTKFFILIRNLIDEESYKPA